MLQEIRPTLGIEGCHLAVDSFLGLTPGQQFFWV